MSGAADLAGLVRAAVLGGLCLTVGVALNGCASVGAASGAAAGVATGLVTANPAVGIGVGIAVQAATDEAVNRYMRGLHTDQQDVIAALAGEMAAGDTRAWGVEHTVPLENGHGHVRVTRVIATPLATCKEFVFSVVNGKGAGAPERWYTASACQQSGGWKWAAAEPAVDRWGNLQ